MPTYSKFMACIHVEGEKKLGILESKKLQSSSVKQIVTKCVESSTEIDLDNFSLKELPDDVFLLLRQSKIRKFNVSCNYLSSVPSLISSFVNLTTLNVSTNRLSTLPRELIGCKQLTSVDISTNNFVEIPSVLFEIETITDVNAKGNFIAEVNEDDIETHDSLEVVNLENNPITPSCRDRLQTISRVRIILSERKLEEWEDLSI